MGEVIILVKGDAKNAIRIDNIKGTLASLRPTLQTKGLVSAGDLFRYQDEGDIRESEEAEYTIEDACKKIDAKKQLTVRPNKETVAPNTMAIVIARGTNDKWAYQVVETETLAAIRLRLNTDKRMTSSDIFLVKEAPVSRDQEGQLAIKDAIDTNNILKVSSQRWG